MDPSSTTLPQYEDIIECTVRRTIPAIPSRSIELVLLLQNAAQFVSRSDLTARKKRKKIRNRTSPDWQTRSLGTRLFLELVFARLAVRLSTWRGAR